MLEFVNVSKSYWTGTQRKIILDKVSFQVELGTSLGILAPNGTGKTTLINLLQRVYDPAQGEIHIDGIDTRTVSRASFVLCMLLTIARIKGSG